MSRGDAGVPVAVGIEVSVGNEDVGVAGDRVAVAGCACRVASAMAWAVFSTSWLVSVAVGGTSPEPPILQPLSATAKGMSTNKLGVFIEVFVRIMGT
jgi:hypothetical protein